MVLYRRNRIEGGTYFFTVTLRDRTSRLLIESVAGLRHSYAEVRSRRPFETVAIVILPDHLHAIWRLPDGDADYSGRWKAIKAGFVRNLRRSGIALAMNATGEAEVWQRRFWEHTIGNDADLRAHVDLRALESGETRTCRTRAPMAAFVVSQIRAPKGFLQWTGAERTHGDNEVGPSGSDFPDCALLHPRYGWREHIATRRSDLRRVISRIPLCSIRATSGVNTLRQRGRTFGE